MFEIELTIISCLNYLIKSPKSSCFKGTHTDVMLLIIELLFTRSQTAKRIISESSKSIGQLMKIAIRYVRTDGQADPNHNKDENIHK